jgi:hypothetical protein
MRDGCRLQAGKLQRFHTLDLPPNDEDQILVDPGTENEARSYLGWVRL